ncbi:TPA: outer membrane lipoprotein-sorting protein [Methanosarcina acetivorans]|jgi:outer membrane lipoprotein-sorting protein|nr:outer membrane lipoprotein-sorting protein [Methanosarcina acetivorans]HIH92679.1 outer membrane lipoprotein-sorting protein [Methanosarcina acetivorans]
MKKMKGKKSLVIMLLITLTLFVSGCQEQELDVEDIAEQMQEKDAGIEDYSYTMYITSCAGAEIWEDKWEGQIEIMYKKPGMMKTHSKNIGGGGSEQLTVSDGEFSWSYTPGINTVSKVKLPEYEEQTKSDYMSVIEYFLNQTEVTLLREEELAGRSVYLLEAVPKLGGGEATEDDEDEDEELSPGPTKIWVDKELWMPLKYETYDSKGNLIQKTEILDLKINTGIPDSEFEFEVPEGAEVITMESAPVTLPGDFEKPGEVPIEEIEEHAGFEPLVPEYLPEGYAFSHSMSRNKGEAAPDGQVYEIVTLTYVNWEEEKPLVLTETVNEGELRESLPEEGENVTINGKEGKYFEEPRDPERGTKRLSWKIGDIELNILAYIEKDELLKIAESI